MLRLNLHITFFLFIGLLLLATNVFTQEADTNKNSQSEKKAKANFLLQNRPWTIEIPLWIPGFAGQFAYGEVSLEGEDGVDPEHPIEPPPGWDWGKLLSRIFTKEWYLKFFFLSKMAFEKNNFLVQFDAIAGGVGNSVKFNYNQTEVVQASFRTVNLRLFGGYRIVNVTTNSKKFRYELYGYLGVRMHFQKISSDLNNIVNRLDIIPKWAEPILGLQNQFTMKRWFIVLAGDYGGFFVNTKYSSMISGSCYYRTGGLTSIKVGWNHLVLNHEGRHLNDDLKIKLKLSGPMVGLAFHF